MKQGLFEHVNMTVSDPDKTAHMLHELFGWRIRWQGKSIHHGYSVHVGTDSQYVALYTPAMVEPSENGAHYGRIGAVNHLGIVVDDLTATETRVQARGIKTHSHQTYDPGRRFYFHDHDGIEYEVVNYT